MTDYTYLRQGRRERIVLGKVLGEGAAGRVCAVPVMPGVAAKIYKTAAEAAEYEEKIEVMVATRPNLPDFPGKRFTCRQIAWPLASLHEPRGAFAGFLMPEIDFAHSRPLESILQKNSRKLDNISEQYRLRVLVAANMATVFAELHRLKHYMIDMKPDNLRLYAKAGYLAVVDTDGFSIRGSAKRFPAQQFTDNYIAPEGRGRRPQDMGEDQDRFALAVILFQLLNNGLHPYSVIMSPQSPLPRELQSRIYANLYAYGLRPHPEIQPAPASIHASFDTTTRQMFDRAFLGGGGGRPRAREWRDHLRSLLQDSVMVTCRVNPAEHAHFGNGCGLCALENRMAAAARRPGARKAVPKPPAPPAWTPSAQRPVPGLAPATAAFHQPAAMSYIPAGRAGAGVATAAVQRRPFHDVAMLVIGIIVVLALVRACVGAVGQGAAEAPAAT
ncbi:MAG TPA: hypothetical protein VEZ12_10465, partial [Herpetosiphonaceae bacterium]|nr:hypothetical protein [Herpetosiphonaceae bacterium]